MEELKEKLQHAEANAERLREQKEREFAMKKEERKLKEEEIQALVERQKRKRENKRIETLDKYARISQNLDSLKRSDEQVRLMKTSLHQRFLKEKSEFMKQAGKLAHEGRGNLTGIMTPEMC